MTYPSDVYQAVVKDKFNNVKVLYIFELEDNKRDLEFKVKAEFLHSLDSFPEFVDGWYEEDFKAALIRRYADTYLDVSLHEYHRYAGCVEIVSLESVADINALVPAFNPHNVSGTKEQILAKRI